MTELRADLERARLRGIDRLKSEFIERVSRDAVSLPGQFPGRDEGDFIEAFGTTEEGVTNDGEYAEALEFKPPSEGGRRPFGKAAEDEAIHAAVVEEIVGVLRNG